MNRVLSILLLAFAACGPSTPTTDSSSTSEAITAAIKPAHMTCSSDGQYPLELLTQSTGAIEALYGDAVVLTGTLKSGKASLGTFLSGAYAVRLTSTVEKGEKGNVTLTDDEGPDNGGMSSYTYACTVKKPVATKYACTPEDSSKAPLSLTVDEKGNVTADYAGDAVSWTSKLTGGNATLGSFLSGEYSLFVDIDVLDGNDGTATLYDDEGANNGGTTAIAYDCTVAS